MLWTSAEQDHLVDVAYLNQGGLFGGEDITFEEKEIPLRSALKPGCPSRLKGAQITFSTRGVRTHLRKFAEPIILPANALKTLDLCWISTILLQFVKQMRRAILSCIL